MIDVLRPRRGSVVGAKEVTGTMSPSSLGRTSIRATNGGWSGGVYDQQAPCGCCLIDRENLEIRTAEAAVIRITYACYLPGINTKEIADELTAMGLYIRGKKERWNVFSTA